MRVRAGKCLLLRGGGGEGPGLWDEIKAAVSAAFTGMKIASPPRRKPLHGTAGRAGDCPLPLFPNGIAAGGKEREQKKFPWAARPAEIFLWAGAEKYHFLRGGGGEGSELFTEAKGSFPPPLPTWKLPAARAETPPWNSRPNWRPPSALIPKRDCRRGKER